MSSYSKGGVETTHHGPDIDSMGEVPCGARSGRTPPSQGGPNKVPAAHGFGHKGKQMDGVHRLSGNPKAHRIGKK